MDSLYIIEDVEILNEDFIITIDDFETTLIDKVFSMPINFDISVYGDLKYLSKLKENTVLSNSWNPLFCTSKTAEVLVNNLNGAKIVSANLISIDGAAIPEKYSDKFKYDLKAIIARSYVTGIYKEGEIFLEKEDWSGDDLFYTAGDISPYLCLTQQGVDCVKSLGVNNLDLRKVFWE